MSQTKQELIAAIEAEKALVAKPEHPSQWLQDSILEIQDNMALVENFKIQRIKVTTDGAETVEGEVPVMSFIGNIIHAKRVNAFYAKGYNPKVKAERPTCASSDGIKPDKEIQSPQHVTCRGCPKAEFGTSVMGAGKACRNLRPLYVVLPETTIPKQLQITPTSLANFSRYMIEIAGRTLNYKKVLTEFTFTPVDDSPYCTVSFRMAGKLDPQQNRDSEELQKLWLPYIEKDVIEQGDAEEVAAASPAQPPRDLSGGAF